MKIAFRSVAAVSSWLVISLTSGCSKPAASDGPSSQPASQPAVAASAVASAAAPFSAAFISAEMQVPDGKSSFHVTWALPEGTEINDDAPFVVDWRTSDALAEPPTNIRAIGKDVRAGFDVPIEIAGHASSASLTGEVALVVCDAKNHSVCLPWRRKLEITFAVGNPREPARIVVELPVAKV